MKIHVRRDTLTDKSVGFDVVLRDDDQEIIIPCSSERHANALQVKLVEAITETSGCTDAEFGDELFAYAGSAVAA